MKILLPLCRYNNTIRIISLCSYTQKCLTRGTPLLQPRVTSTKLCKQELDKNPTQGHSTKLCEQKLDGNPTWDFSTKLSRQEEDKKWGVVDHASKVTSHYSSILIDVQYID